MRTFLFVLFFLIRIITYGQLNLSFEIKLSAEKAATDRLENIYVLSSNILYKYDNKGVLLKTYQSIDGYEITDFDVTNPFKILVLFNEGEMFEILSSDLATLNQNYYFYEKGLYGKNLISVNESGGFWIYNSLESKLLKLNQFFNIEYEKLLPLKESPIKLICNKNYLFFISDSNKIYSYNLKQPELKPVEPEKINLRDIKTVVISYFNFNKQHLYIFENESAKVFTFKTELFNGSSVRGALAAYNKLIIFDDLKISAYSY